MTVNEPIIKGLRTTTPGWQNLCLELAKSAAEFSVENVATKNLVFIDALAAAYEYETVRVQKKVTFLRKDSLGRPALLAASTLQPGLRTRTAACRRENPIAPSIRLCRMDGTGSPILVAVCGG